MTTQKKPGLLDKLFGRKPAPDRPPTRDEIQAWIVARLATHLKVRPEEVDVRESFSNYGLDSRTAVGLSGELEKWLHRELPPTLAWDYPTIELMVKYLVEGDPTAPGANGVIHAPSVNGEGGA